MRRGDELFARQRRYNPAGVLEGTGKHMRHVKLRPGHEVNRTALDALILLAYHDIRRRLA